MKSKLVSKLVRCPLFCKLNVWRCKKQWRKNNADNFTVIGKNLFDRRRVSVGKGTYGELNVYQFKKGCEKLSIGCFCSIAPEVSFLMDGEHALDHLTTYPFKGRYCNQNESLSKGDIVVEDDVWIGYRATVLSGVRLGQGSVIAAGAVVTKNVPPYAIVGGVPAKVIKYRFEPEMIERLLKIDYDKWDDSFIRDNMDLLYENLLRVEQLNWLPMKEEKAIGR